MQGFSYKSGVLHADNVAITDIASEFGTPCYIYSATAIKSNFNALTEAFASRKHQISYAVKANPNLAIINLLAKLGAGFDVVSGGEFARVIRAGAPANKTFFSGVGKSYAEIELAIKSGVRSINLESLAELERIQSVAKQLDQPIPIAVRVNPDVDAKTHAYISTGLKENKFGLSKNQAIEVYKKAQSLSHVNANGIAYHIGSQITTLEPLVQATKIILAIIDELTEIGIEITHMDMGGGLGIRYLDEQPPELEDYVKTLVATVDATHPQLDIAIEPGRSVVGNAGILLTKIEFIKDTGSKKFAIVDAAMNDLIRPSLYDAWMRISEVQRKANLQPFHYDVVGPICESADFLGKNRQLTIEANDFLVIESAGAYAMSMSSNYNSRPRPAEVLVDGDQCHLIRKRETYNQLFELEIIPEDIEKNTFKSQ